MKTWLSAAALLLVPLTSHALEAKIIGGPGYLMWRTSYQGEMGTHTGWGGGISGQGFLELGEHLRISVGMYHGDMSLEDHTRVDRHLFSAGLRGRLPLHPKLYLTAGLEAGPSHLEIAETLGSLEDGSTLVRYSDSWQLMLYPVATVGFRPSPTYHIEAMLASPLEKHPEGWERSLTLMVGLFFWMGDED